MKPDFALSLSFEGLSLLKRTSFGWIVLGYVNLADDDFDLHLEILRREVLDQAPNSDAVKLIIPNDQIKYYSISRPNNALPNDIEQTIMLSLENETPYDLDEIAFDWVTNRTEIFVAAVARQTLIEAEQFALQHSFRPLGNVAVAKEDQFIGEVFFGLADGSQPVMQCDTEPVKIVTAPPPDSQTKFERIAHTDSFTRKENKEFSEKVRGETIQFQTIRHVNLEPIGGHTITDESKTTLIAPLDPSLAHLSSSFDTKYSEKSSFYRGLISFFQKEKALFQRSKGHLNIIAFILIIGTLVSGIGLYFNRPFFSILTEKWMGVETRPDVVASFANPIKNQEPLFYNDPVPMSLPFYKTKAHSEKIATLVQIQKLPNRPHADLRSALEPKSGWREKIAVDVQTSEPIQTVIIPTYHSGSFDNFEISMTPDLIFQPKSPKPFSFLEDRPKRVNAKRAFWSLSPKLPFFREPTITRNSNLVVIDTEINKRYFAALENVKNFEVALNFENFSSRYNETKKNLLEEIALSTPGNDTDHIPESLSLASQNLRSPSKITPSNFDKDFYDIFSNKKLQSKHLSLDRGNLFSQSGNLFSKLKNEQFGLNSRSFDSFSRPQQKSVLQPKIEWQKIANSSMSEIKATESNISSLAINSPLTNSPVRNLFDELGISTEFASLSPSNLRNSSVNRLENKLTPVAPLKPLPINIPLSPEIEVSRAVDDQKEVERPSNKNWIIARPKPRIENEKDVLRPKPRPSEVEPIKTPTGAVAQSLRPKVRPKNVKPIKQVAVALATPTTLPEQEGDEASVDGRAKVKTNSTLVGQNATVKKGLNLRKINLLGVYYFGGQRKALILLSNGKQRMVVVGDRLDGGKVAAIGNSELRYIKSGLNITLELPG